MPRRKKSRRLPGPAGLLGIVWLTTAATALAAANPAGGGGAVAGMAGAGGGATASDPIRLYAGDDDAGQFPIQRDGLVPSTLPPSRARDAPGIRDTSSLRDLRRGRSHNDQNIQNNHKRRLFAEDHGDLCCGACLLTLFAPRFADVPPDGNRLDKQCRSRMQTMSVYLCLRVYCDGYHDGRRMAQLNSSCANDAHQALPPYDALAGPDAFSDDAVARLPRLRRDEATDQTTLSGAVVPAQEFFDQAMETLDAYGYVHRNHLLYSLFLVLYWLVVIFYGICFRLYWAVLGNVQKWRRTAKYQPLGPAAAAAAADDDDDDPDDDPDVDGGVDDDPEPAWGHAETNIYRTTTWLIRRPRVWAQRYLTIPATFGYRCAQDFGWYTVPPRVQSLAILVFVAMNVVACCFGYYVFAENMYWSSTRYQWYRYISDRTGIISYANFPLIWIFGMRNNVLMFLTGWEFGTFNNFHRWVARVATVQAIVHSIGYTIIVFEAGGWKVFVLHWYRLYWWTGEVATIVMSLILLFSFFWFRRHMYEAFLVVHIVFSVLTLAAMLGHVSIFRGRYDGLVWVCSLIWVADRLLRALRILAFNPLFWTTKAQAYYDPQSNIVRLVVPYGSSWYQPQPGTFYYIQVLNDKRFWESHPFTVSSIAPRHPEGEHASCSPWLAAKRSSLDAEPDQPLPARYSDDNDDNDDNDDTDNTDEASGMLLDSSSGSTDVPGSRDDPHHHHNNNNSNNTVPPPGSGSLTFLIRPYSSFTARLRDKAAATPYPRPTPLRVLIDGPYGHSQRFDDFDSVLFVVGGSGIVVPLTHLTGVAQARLAAAAASSSSSLSSGRPRLRSVHIVWAAREAAFAADVIGQDFRGVLGSRPGRPDDGGVSSGLPDVQLDVYITQKSVVELADADADDDDDTDNNNDSAAADEEDFSSSAVLPKAPLRSRLPPHVRIIHSRPDVRGEVAAAIKRTRAGRRLAVMACGPGIMADEARRTVVDMLGRAGTGDVEYLEESFQW